LNAPVGFRTKAPVMAVSLLLSIFLWVGLQFTQPQNVRYLKVPIQPYNDEAVKGKLVIGKLDKAWVQVAGTDDLLQGAIDDIQNKGIVAVYVDLANAHVGTDDYPVHITQINQKLPYTVTLSDSTTSVTIEQKDSRDLPLTIEETGQIPADSNLMFDKASAEPAVVKVEGPSSAVRLVKKVRTFLDLSQVGSSTALPGITEALDENDQQVQSVTLTPSTVRILVALAPAAQSESVIVEPVWKGHPAMGFAVTDYSVEPNQIAVQGAPDVLARLRKVSTKPIILDGLRASTTLDVHLEMPPQVKAYSVQTVRIRIVIEPQTIPGGGTPSVSGP
jgi:YbbR domain-containing protein